MGKKRKISRLTDEHDKAKQDGANLLDDTNTETRTKSKKKVKKANKPENSIATDSSEACSASVTPEIDDSLNTNIKNKKSSKGKKKQKKTHVDDSKSVSADGDTISKKRPAKIKLVGDAPQLDATGSEKKSTKVISKNNNPNLQENEEDVNDEDIDKFCDELTEEDNVQFDDWVKLIEAKLHTKKNK